MLVFNGNAYPNFNLVPQEQLSCLTLSPMLTESVRVEKGMVVFWEAHYFRIMASMRILRLNIPMLFTMEYLQNQIQLVLEENQLHNLSASVLFSFFLNEQPSRDKPISTVSLLLTAKENQLPNTLSYANLSVDLYKDHWIVKGLYGNLESTNFRLRELASVYAFENELEDCILLNYEKQIAESIEGSVFVVKDTQIKTPALTSGCRSSVYRKVVIDLIGEIKDVELLETDISPFEIQKADELFIVSFHYGIKSIKQYRKKIFVSTLVEILFDKWMARYRLG